MPWAIFVDECQGYLSGQIVGGQTAKKRATASSTRQTRPVRRNEAQRHIPPFYFGFLCGQIRSLEFKGLLPIATVDDPGPGSARLKLQDRRVACRLNGSRTMRTFNPASLPAKPPLIICYVALIGDRRGLHRFRGDTFQPCPSPGISTTGSAAISRSGFGATAATSSIRVISGSRCKASNTATRERDAGVMPNSLM